jgi:hypothetical protein
MSFSKERISIILKDLELALKEVEDKHGVLFKVGNATFEPKDFSTRIQCFEKNGDIDNVAYVEFLSLATFYGFNKDDYGKSFAYDGHIYTISGLKKSNRKYPVILERNDGKGFKMSASFVLMRINQ